MKIETIGIYYRYNIRRSKNLRKLYSVMQSDGNSFYGDIVLGSVQIVYRDEDSILYQIYEKQIFIILLLLILKRLKFLKMIEEIAFGSFHTKCTLKILHLSDFLQILW